MIEKYNHLRLKDTAYAPWVINHSSLSDKLSMPRMLSPFVSKEKKIDVLVNEKVIQWVYDNRYDTNTLIEDIKDTYDKFIKHYQSLVISKE